jgi:hypothetical protein
VVPQPRKELAAIRAEKGCAGRRRRRRVIVRTILLLLLPR